MSINSVKQLFSSTFYLTPGECNAEQEMPLWLLTNRIIEVATLHANSWGVGYKTLKKYNHAWVLSRVTIEMKHYPKVGEHYTLTTWIESYNRHFSERNVEITNEAGEILGYARTIWSVINLETRESCDLSKLQFGEDNIADKECPIEKQSRIRSFEHVRESKYTFQYTDIDFNRHVNTIRYICVILNNWSLDFYDKNYIKRFEITFAKETYIGTEVTIGIDDREKECLAELVSDGTSLCKAKIIFQERE